ncbi:MAG: ATP-binding protein [Thermodesulfobacteriota bacterium]|nr:ATP-binding protein [Thermodesulfobacteriota bacterium]
MNRNTAPKQEKRPFRPVKYFAFSSLAAMLFATVIISGINIHWVKKLLQQKNEDYAHLLIENLNHQVYLQFVIPVVLKYGKIKLREEAQHKRMDRVVKNTLHSFNVEMVNIYDMNNIISYSLDKDRIGTQNAGGTGYKKARKKQSTTELVQQGSFFELLMGCPKQTRIITFAPLRAERHPSSISGPVLGVVEIVQNISNDYKKMFRLQMVIISTCFAVMGFISIVLVFIVKQGEAGIAKRSREKMLLEEKLRKTEHLSAIGEMTAGIAHEIRNPLGIIKSSAELLKKKMADLAPSSPIPGIIVEEATRLNNIITDFLDIARPRTLDLQPCSIEKIIEKNLSFLDPTIQEKGIVIEKNVYTASEITGDSDMLYQAFLNILLNSFQAMDDDKRVIITVFSDEKDIFITFEDQGRGITEDALKKIWNPFFTTKETGTGLGLSIVKNIIESHLGEIQISNRTEGGVKVEITLPVKEAGR